MRYMFFRVAAQILVRILFRVKVHGLANIPRRGPFLLSPNHISYLDPVVAGAFIPRQLYYLGRDTLFRFPLFGTLIRWCNCFPVHRERVTAGTIRRTFSVLREGHGLLVFPEGTRSLDGRLQKGRQGAGMIAAKAQVPIIPTLITGSNEALPIGTCFIRLKKVNVYYGRPFRVEGRRRGESGREAYARVSSLIMARIAEIAREHSPETLPVVV